MTLLQHFTDEELRALVVEIGATYITDSDKLGKTLPLLELVKEEMKARGMLK